MVQERGKGVQCGVQERVGLLRLACESSAKEVRGSAKDDEIYYRNNGADTVAIRGKLQ